MLRQGRFREIRGSLPESAHQRKRTRVDARTLTAATAQGVAPSGASAWRVPVTEKNTALARMRSGPERLEFTFDKN